MAIVQYTAAVNQLRGKLNGSVFNKARTSFTLQRKQSQVKRPRGLQGRARQFFQRAQREWKNTSSGQKGSWQSTAASNPVLDRFGQQVVLSGYNQFIKANIQRYFLGLPTLFTGYAAAAPPLASTSDFDIVTYEVDPATGRVFVQVDYRFGPAVAGTEFGVYVDIGLPYSTGITNYQGRFIFVGGGTVITEDDTRVELLLPPTYGIPHTGMLYDIRIRAVHLTSGAQVYESISRVEVHF